MEQAMAYKVITVYLDHSPLLAATVALAADIAIAQGAHLIGAASGADAQAPEALQVFDSVMRRAGVASFATRTLEGDLASMLGDSGRYCDLIVLGRRPPDDPGAAMHVDFCEFIARNSACPVLIAPQDAHLHGMPRHPLVAWNGSRIAARAVHAALPLLHQAGKVTVAIVNSPIGVADQETAPGADIARYLHHHAIAVDLVQQTVDIDAGHALLALADARNSDLLVLGANVHPQFRDVLHQGTTRTVLEAGRIAALLYR
jgi:nucleotide-binding universal stress UspA family protein